MGRLGDAPFDVVEVGPDDVHAGQPKAARFAFHFAACGLAAAAR